MKQSLRITITYVAGLLSIQVYSVVVSIIRQVLMKYKKHSLLHFKILFKNFLFLSTQCKTILKVRWEVAMVT